MLAFCILAQGYAVFCLPFLHSIDKFVILWLGRVQKYSSLLVIKVVVLERRLYSDSQ